MLYSFFWVISQRPNFICRRFRTLCLFHLHRWSTTAYEDGTECSETLEYKIQTPGNHPKEKNTTNGQDCSEHHGQKQGQRHQWSINLTQALSGNLSHKKETEIFRTDNVHIRLHGERFAVRTDRWQ